MSGVSGNIDINNTIIISGDIEEKTHLSLQGDIMTTGSGPGQTYPGPYEFTSLPFIDQDINTKDLRMKSNITIKQIPYDEVSNEFGLTVTISS